MNPVQMMSITKGPEKADERLNQIRGMIKFDVVKDIMEELSRKSLTTSSEIGSETKLGDLSNLLDGLFFSVVSKNLPMVTSGLFYKTTKGESEILLDSNGLLRGKSFKVFRIILHELCHGLSRFFGDGIPRGGLMEPLDEALTEDVSNYIFREYLRRTGDKLLWEEDNTGLYSVKDIEHSNTYSRFRKQLWGYIEKLSVELGVPSDVIYKAWVGHYVGGDFKVWFKDFILATETDPKRLIFDYKSYKIQYSVEVALEFIFDKFKSLSQKDISKKLGATDVDLL